MALAFNALVVTMKVMMTLKTMMMMNCNETCALCVCKFVFALVYDEPSVSTFIATIRLPTETIKKKAKKKKKIAATMLSLSLL